jgi:outer membrane protein assembly factor BamB
MTLVAVAPDRSTIVVVEQPISQVELGSDLRERRMIVLDVSGDTPVEVPVESLGTGRDVIATFTADGRVLLMADGSSVIATDIGDDGTWREVLTAADTITSMARAESGAVLIGTSAGDVLSVPASRVGSAGTTQSSAPNPSSVLARLPGIVAMWPSPERPWVAIQSADGTVRVIDTDSGELVVALPEATATTSAAWAGDVLALAHGDGIHLWDLSVERALDRVCELAGRGLSAEERARHGIDTDDPAPACS